MSWSLLHRIGFLRKFIFNIWVLDAKHKILWIRDYLNHKENILDFGAGSCSVCRLLRKKGFKIVPLDIHNLSLADEIKPYLYDGEKIPFKDNSFDTALILTVLHHTSHPKEIIKEVMRVAKRIIIIEEIYRSRLQKYLTFIYDSIFNFEFFGHPHSNKRDLEWKAIFNELNLKLVDTKYDSYFLFIRRVAYCLEKEMFIK
jgi:ubiquinone/menaquinone biosynthesis C-methylase UbiE